MTETTLGPWRRSSYSANEGNCVEVARTATSGAVRDSKDPDGGHLEVPLAGLVALAKAPLTGTTRGSDRGRAVRGVPADRAARRLSRG